MNEPRNLVQRFEKNPQLPKGDGEILCSRHVLASSFGPAYTAIWHRDPEGRWRFYQDVPPRQGGPRFFGKALAGVTVLPIETHWDRPRRLRIVAPVTAQFVIEDHALRHSWAPFGAYPQGAGPVIGFSGKFA